MSQLQPIAGATERKPSPPAPGTALLKLAAVEKSFGAARILKRLDLEAMDGEFLSLLGPSGCGKTTTLRIVAGFERCDAGSIWLGGEDITLRPPNKRDVSTVFQDYSLFPHMTVAQNVAFGLVERRLPKAEIAGRVAEMLDMVRLPEFGARKPAQLSGGQKQRVALARSLAVRPRILLLDEPLGALDLKLRRDMQFELRAFQRRLGITFIYVTHDQEEALTMSDRIVVMKDGEVQQIGGAREIYDRPANRFVAEFIGETTLLPGELKSHQPGGGLAEVVFQHQTLLVSPGTALLSPGTRCLVSIRPEKVRLTPGGHDGSPNRLEARIDTVVFRGAVQDVMLRLSDGTMLRASVPASIGSIQIGQPAIADFAPADAILLEH